MKFAAVAGLSLMMAFSFNAVASEVYDCVYSKASLDNGKMGQMIGSDPAKVEYDGSSFKAYRPSGVALISPKLNAKQGSVTLANDGIKVFAVSDDHKTFAVSDRIGKTTEQWDKCSVAGNAKSKDEGGIKPIKNPKHRALNSIERQAIETAITEQLKDPYSAKFKFPSYIYNGNGEYCGYVNSKNSYGGYVGNTPFLVMLVGKGKETSAAVISFGSGENEMLATLEVCRKIGY